MRYPVNSRPQNAEKTTETEAPAAFEDRAATVLRAIARDARLAPEQFLKDTEVPAGGE